MGSLAGVMKVAAHRCGMAPEAYLEKLADGQKRCTSCKEWRSADAFGADSTRADGRSACCLDCRGSRYRKTYVPHPLAPGLSGPQPKPARDGDRKQARQRINVEVRGARRPHPNTLACVDCGHVWKQGERRHEYDHHNGYAAKHHYDVVPVCTQCHHRRDNARARQTHCKNGHEFTFENTVLKSNGNRVCRACRRQGDRKRVRPPGHWKRVNDKRKAAAHG